jgi:ATP-dependent Zn protease
VCAEQVLAENRDVLEALAERLFEEETLDHERLEEFFQSRALNLPDKACVDLHVSD